MKNIAILKVTDKMIYEAKMSYDFLFWRYPRDLKESEIALLSELYKTRNDGDKAIRYYINFGECKRLKTNNKNKSCKIFCKNVKKIRKPFGISDFKVSSKNYRRSPDIVYLKRKDVNSLISKGLLS